METSDLQPQETESCQQPVILEEDPTLRWDHNHEWPTPWFEPDEILTHTQTPDLQELWNNKFVLFYVAEFVVIFYIALEN